MMTVSSGNNDIEQFGFLIFTEAPESPCADIGHLNHSSKAAVYKKWGFHNVLNACPECAALEKLSHHVGMLFCHGLIHVVDNERKTLIAIGGRRLPSYPLFETRYDLFECLLIN